ncbi:MAG: dockerin type I repeat-containing protein [Prevotella sp.]|nr:dockerin type I repeat-containing protein [Prevotella sp.]
MKKAIILFVLLLLNIAAYAQNANAVAVYRTNGQVEYFVFSARPKITYQGDCLVMEANSKIVQYSLIGLKRIAFETIEVESDVLGDMDGDKKITATDLVIIITTIASGSYSEVADVNKDGIVNIADVVMVSNIILNEKGTEL